MMNRAHFLTLGAVVGLCGTVAFPAAADPVLRHTTDIRGDAQVIGSTLAYDCASTAPLPPGANVSCSNQWNTSDTAGDLYWRDNIADQTVAPSQARTSATLDLPAGSTIKYARLYWAALRPSSSPDSEVVIDRKYGSAEAITADHCHDVIPFPFASHPEWYYYQCSGDATGFVTKAGPGDFRVTGVDAIDLAGTLVHVSFSNWTLVVFYEDPNDDMRNLALFDGFQIVDPEHDPPSVSAELSGFLVPDGFQAKMTAFVYEGDIPEPNTPSADHFTINGIAMGNGTNPVDDFFNSSRSFLGTAYSGDLDVPKLSGEAGTMAGYDLDTVDITSAMSAGDTSATIGVDSAYDKLLLGGFVTSIMNKAPNFHQMAKDVQDVNGGAVLPGDVLEYTITAQNTGNDAAVDAVITDDLDPGIDFVPGSIEIVSGGSLGTKTDQAGDDEGEFVSDRVTVRVGTGATAYQGGTVAIGQTVIVKFRVRVTANAGQIANTAILTASGESGAQEREYESDGDPNTVGDQATVVVVDECSSDADCSGLTPHCDPETHTCVGCTSDTDCTDPLLPACQPDGSCGECSATNATLCVDPLPVCEVSDGVCVMCTPGPNGDASMCVEDPNGPLCIAGANESSFCGCETDSDCGAIDSGRVCDTSIQICVDGCRGVGGNGCPTELGCTSPDTTIGQCVPDGHMGDQGTDPNAYGGDPVGVGSDGGCACSTTPQSGGRFLFTGLFALGALAWMRRRRQ